MEEHFYNGKKVEINGDFLLGILPFLREVIDRERAIIYEEKPSESIKFSLTRLGSEAASIEQSIWEWHTANIEAGKTEKFEEDKAYNPTLE